MKNKYWLTLVIIIVAFFGGWIFLMERPQTSPTLTPSPISTPTTTNFSQTPDPSPSTLPVPNDWLAYVGPVASSGWYSHWMSESYIIFTPDKELTLTSDDPLWTPNVLALGDQIQFNGSSDNYNGSPQSWASINIGTASGTMGLPPVNDWGTLDGYQTLRVPSILPVKNGLDYILFTSSTVYTFFAYPISSSTIQILQEMVTEFAKNLQVSD
ncbi:MAG TPA: hypothetical protein VHZ04_03805 [Candidatus Paceibacterota bacterium]|jgi:hypothetical protein|nr:hypothetical protein [Candidatus Paceibacterota bacterium]